MVYVCLDSGLWVERKHSLLDDKHEMVCDKPSMENGREKRFGYQAASLSGPSVSKNNLRGFSLWDLTAVHASAVVDPSLLQQGFKTSGYFRTKFVM